MRRRRHRFLKEILIGVPLILLGLYLAAGLGLLIKSRSAARQADMLLQEAAARGEPTTQEELREAFSAPAGSVNLDTLLLQAAEEPDLQWGAVDDVYLFGDRECSLNEREPLVRACVEGSRALLEQADDLLNDIDREVANREIFIPWLGGPDYRSEHLSGVRNLVRLSIVDAVVWLADGDAKDACRSVRLVFQQTAALRRSPVGISHLVAGACEDLGFLGVAMLLRSGEVPDESLAALQEALGPFDCDAATRNPLREARAELEATDAEQIAEMQEAIESVQQMFGRPPLPPRPLAKDQLVQYFPCGTKWLSERFRLDGLTFIESIDTAGPDAPSLVAALHVVEPDADCAGAVSYECLAENTLRRTLDQALSACGKTKAVATAIAAERYRIASGKMPRDIDALVPEFLEAVPIDPFDGKTIRMKETERGLVFYSIGNDRIDDGGFVVWSKGQGRPRDAGIELLRPQHRGIEIIEDEE